MICPTQPPEWVRLWVCGTMPNFNVLFNSLLRINAWHTVNTPSIFIKFLINQFVCPSWLGIEVFLQILSLTWMPVRLQCHSVVTPNSDFVSALSYFLLHEIGIMFCPTLSWYLDFVSCMPFLGLYFLLQMDHSLKWVHLRWSSLPSLLLVIIILPNYAPSFSRLTPGLS